MGRVQRVAFSLRTRASSAAAAAAAESQSVHAAGRRAAWSREVQTT